MSLEITKLSKRLGNDWVLRDVDLVAQDARVLGLCGATGSGKSTLLSIIAGRLKPEGGTIFLDGRNITNASMKERGVSLLTGNHTPGLLNVIGLRSPKNSTGQRQIQVLDEVLQTDSKVVLLDDPFSQVDVHLRRECFAKVRRAAHARDRIVVVASSDFEQIADLADDAAILAGGSIVQTGLPHEMYENPETIEASRVTGDNNLFEARRLSSADAEFPEFHTIDGGHRIFAQTAEKGRLGAINRNVMLSIRPEQISMTVGKSFPEENSLRGVVTAIQFLGATTLVEFEASGLRLTVRVFRIGGLQVGDECMLGLPPHRIRILRD